MTVSANRKTIAAVTAIAALGGAGLLAAGGFAAWQGTAEKTSGVFGAATVSLTANSSGSTAFDVGSDNMIPDDAVERTVEVKNTGSAKQRVVVTTTPTGELATAMTPTSVAADTAALTGAAAIPADGFDLAPGASKFVKYTFKLPATAPATLQGKQGTFKVDFKGTAVK